VNTVTHKPRVAIQGERGSFSEEAAFKLFGPEVEIVLQNTFAALYSSIDNGEAEYVLAPTWNTILGPVPGSVELLRKSSLIPINTVRLRVNQHLIGCPGATLTGVATVISHPAALAQCKRFFAEHPRIKPLVAQDTAGSVAEIMRRGKRTFAALAGRRAAELYGATVIRPSIQDEEDNFTEFSLLVLPGSNFDERYIVKGKES
jgi:prephenate dehydratase